MHKPWRLQLTPLLSEGKALYLLSKYMFALVKC